MEPYKYMDKASMKKMIVSIGLVLLGIPALADDSVSLWYTQPAEQWEEALPLGNGRMGAMVFGGVQKERLQLNEESLWAGAPLDVYPDDFKKHHEQLQRLVLEGKIDEAHKYGRAHMTQSPTSFRSYEPLANLWIESDSSGSVRDYRRDLDIQSGVATVSYECGGVRFKREVFISAVDDVMAVRITADKPGAVSGTISQPSKTAAMLSLG